MKHVLIAAVAAVLVAVVVVACGGGSGSNPIDRGSQPTGTVNTLLSDPATCVPPNGPYSAVYITVVDVKAHSSATAGDSDGGWMDLTPGLSANPKQINLLGLPQVDQCFLALLGSQTQLPAGSYQQIRVILLANGQGATIPNNQCTGNDANCVVLAANGSVHTLKLSSEAQTGIKIPSGQIAGGRFTVPANSTVDLNVDINCCASIVVTGNGQYRLKPVMHAGEVTAQDVTAISIRGRVIDKATGQPIVGGNVIVALEQKDPAPSNVDRVIMQTKADGLGNFVFCPVFEGTYDVVAAAVDNNGVAYAATVTTGVPSGTTMGDVPLIATPPTNTGPASIAGKVTTTTGSAGTPADISLAALQTISGGTMVTVPLAGNVPPSVTVSLTTAADVSCPANTDCASYTIAVPGVNPNVGAFNSGGTTYTQDTVSPVSYTLDGLAFVVSSGGTADCTPPEQQVTVTPVAPGGNLTAGDLAFTGCQ